MLHFHERVAFTWDTGYHLSPLWSHWFPVIIPQQIPLLWHLNMLICFKICGGQPQACSLHTLPGGPELPSTEQSPHGRTACPPKGLSWAGGNTGGGSVCAWQRRQYTFKGFYHNLRDFFFWWEDKEGKYLQKKRNVIDKEFDPEEKDKGGCRHFPPAFWSNFGNLGIIVHKEKLIIWGRNRTIVSCHLPTQNNSFLVCVCFSNRM